MKRVLVYFEPPFVHKGNTENFWGVVGADIGHTWIFSKCPHYQMFHFAASFVYASIRDWLWMAFLWGVLHEIIIFYLFHLNQYHSIVK